MHLSSLLISFLVWLIVGFPAGAQTVDVVWERSYSIGQNSYGKAIRQTQDQTGYIVVGQFVLGDIVRSVVLKVDATGEQEWTKVFGGSLDDNLVSIENTADGGYVTVGATQSFAVGINDVWVVKTDVSGNEVWSKTFGGPGNEFGSSIKQTTDFGYVITGGNEGGILMLKLDNNGSFEWERSFKGKCGTSIQITNDGGYIICGVTATTGEGETDIRLIKTDQYGNSEWENTFGGTNHDWGYEAQQTSDGGFVIFGSTMSVGAGDQDMYLLKTDANGSLQWSKSFGGIQMDVGSSGQQASDGGYVLAGRTHSFGSGGSDYYIVKTNHEGVLEWEKVFGGYDAYASSIRQTSEGAYVLAGTKVGSAAVISVAKLLVPPKCVQSPSCLVAWLPGDGYATDISGHYNMGTLIGSVEYGSGKVADAFLFRANSSYLEIPSSDALNFGAGNFTIDAWIKTDNGFTIAEKLGAAGYRFYIADGQVKLDLTVSGVTTTYFPDPPLPSATFGQWNFVAVTVDQSPGGGIHFTVDDQTSAANQSLLPGSVSSTAPLRIGSRIFVATGNEDRYVDEIELFNCALPPSEIQAIYNAGSFGKCKPACSPRPGSVDVAVQAGWNMLTVPVSNPTPDNLLSSLFPGSTPPAVIYTNRGYEPQDAVSNCDGFWLRFANAATITITGNLLCELSCPLKRGWNLIGGISVPVEVNKLRTIPPRSIESRFFGLASGGGYETSTTLEPGKGYWVKLSDDAKLIISAYGLLQKVANTDFTDVLRSYNNLTVTDGAGRGQTLYFGKYPSENPSVEYFSMPPIPPDGVFDVRFQSDRMVEVYSSAGSSETYRVMIHSAAYPLTLSLRMANANKERVTVTDGLGGKLLHSTELGNGGTVTVTNPEVTSLLITVDKEAAVPTKFALHPAYPNPFNPTTQIAFDLPRTSWVSLKVYDLLGREVATLFDKQEYEAGAHETVFDAGHLASGIYVYRLTAQSEGSTFSDVKKMVVIR